MLTLGDVTKPCALMTSLPPSDDALAWPGHDLVDHGRAEAHRAVFDLNGRIRSVRPEGDARLEIPPNQDLARLAGPLRADDRRRASTSARVSGTDDERIVAPAAAQLIYPKAAINDVVARATVNEVIAVVTDNDVVARFTVDCVVSSAADDPVMARASHTAKAIVSEDNIITAGAKDAIIAAPGLGASVRAIGEVPITVAANHDAVDVLIEWLAQVVAGSSFCVAPIALACRQSARKRHSDCPVAGHPHGAGALVLGDGIAPAPAADGRVSIGRSC